MSLSVANLVLRAKQLEIEELKRLQSTSHFVGLISHMIHVLQNERGASSIFLASSGKRFQNTRQKLIQESETVEQLLRTVFTEGLEHSANARIISLAAWVLLGLDALPELRKRIEQLQISGAESVTAFSRLIAGLISLILEVADTAVNPEISRLLISLFNLVEGKELAGQERATGALAFGSGICDRPVQERVLHLIDAQEHNMQNFLEFAEEPIKRRWHAMQNTPCISRQNQLRQMIRTTEADTPLAQSLSDAWFECCSERITHMWSIQRDLVAALQQRCAKIIEDSQHKLSDSEGLLQSLKDIPPTRADAIDRFFDPNLPLGHAVNYSQIEHQDPHRPTSLIDVLQEQSRHLTEMEHELASAKRALTERKLIERAKGVIMSRESMSESEAYQWMRKVSMDQNLRLIQVAESVLALP